MDRIRVYGYPRSGSHFLMRTLGLTFYRDLADYRELFGSHFAPPKGRSVGIIRQPFAVAESLWDMRHWFGLTGAESMQQFISQTYRESYRPGPPASLLVNFGDGPRLEIGRDECFAEVDMKPIEHQAEYGRNLRCQMLVSYEELLWHPQETVDSIADKFSLPRRIVCLPPEKVGYDV